MRKRLNKICKELKIECFGIADVGPYDELREKLEVARKKGFYTSFEEEDIHKRIDPRLTMKNVKSIIVFLFPYYTEEVEDSNLSNYTYGRDYHIVVKEKLDTIGEYLRKEEEDFEYMSFVDSGPMSERYLAYRAGLGFYGVNSHIITDKYGSYVFIGYMMTNYPFEPDKPMNRTCIQCSSCVKNCPGQTILGDFYINPHKCKSYLTQKKGDLPVYEKKIIGETDLIFGCDVCQQVCPHNKGIQETNIDDFKDSLIHRIDYEELANLSNREFKRRYGDRAFSWRGKKILQRNYDIINKRIIE